MLPFGEQKIEKSMKNTSPGIVSHCTWPNSPCQSISDPEPINVEWHHMIICCSYSKINYLWTTTVTAWKKEEEEWVRTQTHCQRFTFPPHFSLPQISQPCGLKTWFPQLKRETWHLFLSFPSFILPTLHIPYTCKPSLTHTLSLSVSFRLCHRRAQNVHVKSFSPVSSLQPKRRGRCRVCFMDRAVSPGMDDGRGPGVCGGGGGPQRRDTRVRQGWRQ